MEDDHLVTRDNYKEYDNTYFVLEVSNRERPELADFDYTVSFSDIMQLARYSSDFTLFKAIKTNYD